MVAMSFRNAKSAEEFERAESLWNELRPGITSYETSLNCKDYGASYDKQIAIDLVGELLEKPVDLMLDVGKLIFALAGGERDETLEALKGAAKELAKETGKEIGKKIARKALPQNATNKFREALLKYLQSKSKRSRKYFLQIITDIEGVAKAYGGLAIKVSGALKPSRINPDECGMGEWVERERSEALVRVFATVQGTTARSNGAWRPDSAPTRDPEGESGGQPACDDGADSGPPEPVELQRP
jgi:hypothetical protein